MKIKLDKRVILEEMDVSADAAEWFHDLVSR